MEIAIPPLRRLHRPRRRRALRGARRAARAPTVTLRRRTSPGRSRTDTGMLALVADAALDDVPTPTSSSSPAASAPDAFAGRRARSLDWIRRAHATSTWTTSVCTGSLLLGAAGLLDGVEATTHWLASTSSPRSARARRARRRRAGQGHHRRRRVVGHRHGAPLAARIAGDDVAQAIQLGIEYDPQPPFDAGALGKAPPAAEALVRAAVDARRARAGV